MKYFLCDIITKIYGESPPFYGSILRLVRANDKHEAEEKIKKYINSQDMYKQDGMVVEISVVDTIE